MQLLTQIKKLIPERYKGIIVSHISPPSYPEFEPWKERKKVIITVAGFYQNLGDLALTYAQKQFIQKTLPNYEVLLVPSIQTYSHMKALKRIVRPDDIITIIGGGNMDDMYPSLENARRFVVKNFKSNPIISFPQTMSFSNTVRGKMALHRSRSRYNSHNNLTIFGREPRSFESMRAHFDRTNVELTPDIVLSLALEQPYKERSGIMLMLREDKEARLPKRDREKIVQIAQSYTDNVYMKDTVDISLEECQPATFENTLKDFWRLVGSHKLAITDRLHGLIFCVITRTPVIVLPNSNHKIKESYKAWLQGFTLVRYLDSFDAKVFSETIEELYYSSDDHFDGPDLSEMYKPLRKALLSAARESDE